MKTNDNAPEGERWIQMPSRAKHDEPITPDTYARRQAARWEAEAVVANRFEKTS